jgi:hypothetical protein
MSEHRFFPLAMPDVAINPKWWLYILCQHIVEKGIGEVLRFYADKGGRRDLGLKLVERADKLQKALLADGIVGWDELDKYALREMNKVGRVVSNYGGNTQTSTILAVQKEGYFELKRIQSNIQFQASSGTWYILEFQDDLILLLNHKEIPGCRKPWHEHNGKEGVKRWLEGFGFDLEQQHKPESIDIIKQYEDLRVMFPKGKPDFSVLQELIFMLINLDLKDLAERTGEEYVPKEYNEPYQLHHVPLYWRSYYRIAGAWAFELMTKEDGGTPEKYIGGITGFLEYLKEKWKNGWTEDIQPKLNLDNTTTRSIITLFKDAMNREKRDVASGGSKPHQALVLAYMIHQYQK